MLLSLYICLDGREYSNVMEDSHQERLIPVFVGEHVIYVLDSEYSEYMGRIALFEKMVHYHKLDAANINEMST